MNYLLLPDLAAMAMLLGILYFLRRRHPGETVDLWLVAPGLHLLGGDHPCCLSEAGAVAPGRACCRA